MKTYQLFLLLFFFLGIQVVNAAVDPKNKLMTHKTKKYNKPRFKATWLQDNGKQKPSKKKYKKQNKTVHFYNSKRIR